MRAALAALLAGESLTLAGVGLWSVPAAMVLAGIQLVAFAALREFGGSK